MLIREMLGANDMYCTLFILQLLPLVGKALEWDL